MAMVQWELVGNRPAIRVLLCDPHTGRETGRVLLADTGAGSKAAPFELLVDEEDCLLYARKRGHFLRLSGAYAGEFRVYDVNVRIEHLGYLYDIPAVGVSKTPRGFDGIAGFRFLSRFNFGNFGDPERFGLESLWDLA